MLKSQEKTVTVIAYDTLHVKRGNVLLFEDSVLFISRDSTLLIPDSIKIEEVIDLSHNSDKRTEIFFDSLEHYSAKRKVTKELYNLLIPSKPSKKEEVTPVFIKSEKQFFPYNDKIIRNIRFKRLDAFGTSVNDTSQQTAAWIGKAGNKVHSKTKKFIIRNNLLFAKGDKLDPYVLADNERILRALSFIKDTRIVINQVETSNDSVDIEIITRDIWSIGVTAQMSAISSYKIGIFDANILGLGRRFENTIYINGDSPQKLGYEGGIKADNLSNTFISGELKYRNKYTDEYSGIKFTRKFISSEIKYAGGLEIARQWNLYDYYTDTSKTEMRVAYNFQDVWIGRAFNSRLKNRHRIVVSGRYYRSYYYKRPKVTETTFLNYHHRQMFLLGISLENQNFFRNTMIYGFGRREDIPYGHLIELTTGLEKNEYKNRAYLGVKLSKGFLTPHKGYLQLKLDCGSFINKKRLEQGVIDIQLNYFSKIIGFKGLLFREFIKIRHTGGFRKLSSDSLNINNYNGIRGLSHWQMYGNRRLVMSLENVCFMPFDVYGFRFTVFNFFDMGFVGRKKIVFKNEFYSGLGLGMRIRNENLVFKTIQIRIAWYPKTPDNISHIGYDIGTSRRLKLEGFEGKMPSVISY